jgi:hypothetical protein
MDAMQTMWTPLDIFNFLGHEIPVIATSELWRVKSLDQLFGKSDSALVLYQTNHNGEQKIGHWVCLVRDGDDVYFYDPYGTWPDDQYDYIPMSYRKETNQMKDNLSRLLYYSPYKNLHYNPHQHQMKKKGVNTCGRHCALYLYMALEPEKYNEMMKEISEMYGGSYDEMVTKITSTNK